MTRQKRSQSMHHCREASSQNAAMSSKPMEPVAADPQDLGAQALQTWDAERLSAEQRESAEAAALVAAAQPLRERLLAEVAALPALPGVYRFLDARGQVLYVGKAKLLKRRVSSYFQRDHQGTRIGLMVARIAKLETTVVRTEAEALLLENTLIKSLNPRFNILFRDDKSYPYLRFTAHEFARVSYYRGSVDRRGQYFGPYPNGLAVRQTIELVQRVFRLRTCEDAVFNHRSRPCLLHQIRRCTAPCVGLIDAESYRRDVERAATFLRGGAEEVMGELQRRMANHAEALEYERAAELRDQIASLAQVLQQQAVEASSASGSECRHRGTCAAGAPVSTRRWWWPSPGGSKPFPAQVEEGTRVSTEEEGDQGRWRRRWFWRSSLSQHYLGAQVPPLVLVIEAVDPALAEALGQQAGHRVVLQDQPRGPRRIWLDMCIQGAELALQRLLAEEGLAQARTVRWPRVLGLDQGDLAALRIECFDISHTAGEATVALCVVFSGTARHVFRYRRRQHRRHSGGDDYAAMRQVLMRRYERMGQGEGEVRWPDVVLIDGGKGYIKIAREVFEALGIDRAHRGCGKGRRPQGGSRVGVCRWPRQAQLAAAFGRPDAGGGDSR
ncbi:MAG: excinuclease ABC subunit UvrC [Inhella sp.]